ncbi:phage antirepressor KilAC domain-containing protein [Paenibacillus sp. VTT E-133291]|uniref:phage antirepressor KilAC domain-containing protein n=1 Tax=Paenibacillus sp. VTT E-133291 TaxID=1986223 RepID=UPI000BA0E442|nr:phage antirepressor KilAC domain-containing protein [Paenibacillus sp. VTT E-133291]OZQ75716.1 hypothetical protein CA598_30840 [Paenibacillus sp. VTT E-133291]
MEELAKVINIEGVRGYLDENGNAFLNIEDVARGLGFTTVATSGNDVVRWSRVQGYLDSFGYSQQAGKDDFIPESIFYRLAMKAKNEVAEAFQIKIAEEILPSIRKHQAYITPTKLEEIIRDPDLMIGLLQELKHEQQERARLQAEVAVIQPKADKYTEFLDAEGLTNFTTIGKQFLGGVEAEDLTKFLQGHGVLYGREVDKCFPPRKGYEKYFRILPYYRGGYLLNKSVKATTVGIDFIVELYRKHDGKVPELREPKRIVAANISVSLRNSA